MNQPVDVVGAVFIRDGAVFAAQRGALKAQPGLWEFPGGKIEPGERPEMALARELREELLIDATVTDHICTSVYDYGNIVIRLATYRCEIRSGTPQLTEHAAVRWVPIEQLHTLDWAPADIEAVQKIQEVYG